MRNWKILLIIVVLFTAACGKNDGYPLGYSPYGPVYQAPAYQGAYPYGTGYAGYPGYNQYPTFNPSLPSGYPSAYTPFLPLDYYMRNNPAMVGYWSGFWNQWVGYCGRMGYSPYNFNYFWYSYVPQYWSYGPYQQLYSYFNQTFYYWMSPGMQFSPVLAPSTFWSSYQGYGYGPAWVY